MRAHSDLSPPGRGENTRSTLSDHALNADARRVAGHTETPKPDSPSEIAPFDLFLQGLDLLLHALEAGIDLNCLAVGVQRVLVVADVLHDEAKARQRPEVPRLAGQ